MLPINTILVPTDFSKRSEQAFQFAGALARDHGAKLVVLHVMPASLMAYGEGVIAYEPEGYEQSLRDKLHQLKVNDPRVEVDYRLHEGDAATEILHVAGEVHADLIVMGTHGRSGLARLLIGSVAEYVLRKADCPVLTLKTPFPTLAPLPEKKEEEVLVAAGH